MPEQLPNGDGIFPMPGPPPPPVRSEVNWKQAVAPPLLFVVVLWIIELITDLRWISRPVEWGILPRSVEGLVGILTAPFIHADTDHLLANTLPLLVVGTGLFYFYRELAFRVIALGDVLSFGQEYIKKADGNQANHRVQPRACICH